MENKSDFTPYTATTTDGKTVGVGEYKRVGRTVYLRGRPTAEIKSGEVVKLLIPDQAAS
jgi:hypothetical protein